MLPPPEKRIVIAGGGFGGVRAALNLAASNLANTRITLISNLPHFEYHSTLYRVVTGKSPLEVCIPLREIFAGIKVELVEDTINAVNLTEQQINGASGSRYSFDYLILALGSETSYFAIPGLRQFSFGFKSITEALRLKRHLHEMFEQCQISSTDQAEDVKRLHLVIVGGGASGTELAGELATYCQKVSGQHGLPASLVTIDLVEAAPRLVPNLPTDMADKIKERLHHLGVNVFLNRAVTEQEVEELYLPDMTMKTKTVIWTAGTRPNRLYASIAGLEFDQRGHVLVDEYLKAKDQTNVFVIGDAAATPYTGMAQTALIQGKYAARYIASQLKDQPLKPYVPNEPAYAIPIGSGWAAVLVRNFRIYGQLGWWIRRLADLRFFLSILPVRKAMLVWQSGRTLCESCQVCLAENTPKTD